MDRVVIGLAGPAGVGKSTVQDMVIQWAKGQGITAEAINFADPLRDLSRAINPVLREVGYARQAHLNAYTGDYAWLKEHTNYREFLVDLGHGARVHLGWDVWVDAWKRRRDSSAAQLVVAADVRYLNEAKAVLGLPTRGEVWHLSRAHIEPANETEAESLRTIKEHLTDEDDYCPFTIADGRLDMLREKVEFFMNIVFNVEEEKVSGDN